MSIKRTKTNFVQQVSYTTTALPGEKVALRIEFVSLKLREPFISTVFMVISFADMFMQVLYSLDNVTTEALQELSVKNTVSKYTTNNSNRSGKWGTKPKL